MCLKHFRMQAGLTQKDLARKAGMRQATISAIENGLSHPRKATVQILAKALEVELETVRQAIAADANPVDEAAVDQLGHDWPFLEGLGADLRKGLARDLVASWTHTSTAIEGNTISAGDTLFVITEGLTVSGKSLREHQEIHGHAQAIGLLAGWTRAGRPVRTTELHELHRAVQTGETVDALAPVGRWKVEPNGTTLITTGGGTAWHDYAAPMDVPALIDDWIHLLSMANRSAIRAPMDGAAPGLLLDAYTDVHLGFVTIHPYADGNGRLARLLANVPVLRSGLPPLLVDVAARRDYSGLLGDYSLARGRPLPGEPLVLESSERDALRDFFAEQWRATLDLVDTYRQRQSDRR